MRPRERPAADLGVEDESLRQDRLEVHGRLPVPELAHVEVARHAVDALVGVEPAEEDVARRLHQPLALDDALAAVRERARAQERLEDGRARLLDLEEEWVGLV